MVQTSESEFAFVRNCGLFLALCLTALAGCAPDPEGEALAQLEQAENGVPVDGFPNYHERLMLLAINRARSDPNNVALETSGACGGSGSTAFAASKPLVYNLAGSHASRFHCQNCNKNGGGLSHNSYCTLKSDIAATGCDGSLDCACEPGSDHFSCETLGGHGTNPWGRCGLFGFGANGEVGSAGYSDGWTAVVGWVTECPSAEGHRRILLDADGGHTEIGLGYADGGSCWGRLYFGDTASGSVSIPRMPAASHRPESGSNVQFYVNYYDAAGAPPLALDVVIDGACQPLTLEIGTPAAGTYKASASVGSGCHQYWFLARDASGARHTYPAAGAWGVGNCTDYQPTATEAACETCNNGETKNCGTDVGACEFGSQVCAGGAWGPCTGGTGPLPEDCNGRDDDCDGQLPTDEGDADGDGVLACAGDCDDADAARHPGATETCNGVDDDCDSSVDEGCGCDEGLQRPCGTDEGECQAGTQRCSAGVWGDCQGAIEAQPESCNDLDDDCDGQTDEDCPGDGGGAIVGGCSCGAPASLSPLALLGLLGLLPLRRRALSRRRG